jgi:hypothetical protein
MGESLESTLTICLELCGHAAPRLRLIMGNVIQIGLMPFMPDRPDWDGDCSFGEGPTIEAAAKDWLAKTVRRAKETIAVSDALRARLDALGLME